jgi:hypothetical protein
MENQELEFIDRAVSMIKEGYTEDAARLLCEESNLSLSEARVLRDLLSLIIE